MTWIEKEIVIPADGKLPPDFRAAFGRKARVTVYLQEQEPGEMAGGDVLSDVVGMRERLAESRSGDEIWNVKSRAGGVLDIELLAQALALVSGSTRRHPKSQLDAAASAGWLDPDDLARLRATHELLIQVQHVQRLLGEEQFDVERLGAGGLSVLLGATSRESVEELEHDLRTGTAECDAIISRVLDRE